MFTSFLDTTKFHNLFPQADRKYPSVVNLSDVLDEKVQGKDLPPLCAAIYRKDKTCRCHKVYKFVSDIVRHQRKAFPFAFCCWAGAKVLAIPHEKETYLLFCRSPFLHESPLRKIVEDYKLDIEYVKELSDLLPRFGLQVVKLGLQLLAEQKKVEISGNVRSSLIRLAKAYGQYEFDMVIYDSMQAIPRYDDQEQVVVIRFVSKPRKKPVVRIVFNESGSNGEDWGIPIIGMAVEAKQKSKLAESLRAEAVEDVGNVIETALTSRKLKLIGKIGDSQNEIGKGAWALEGGIYANNGQRTGEHTETVKQLVVRSVEVGSGTFYTSLISALDGELEIFLKRLSTYVERLKDTFGTKDIQDKQGQDQNLHCRALADIEAALADLLQKRIQAPNTVKQVLKDLLNILKDYPLWLPAPMGQKAEERRDCIYRDMLKNRCNYLNSLKYEIEVLEAQLYDESATEGRKMALSIWADFFAVLSKWLTLGTVYSCDVGADIRSTAHHRYIKNRLPLTD